MKNKKIFIIAGGTAGHIFPALSVLNSFAKQKDIETYFITDKRGSRLIPENINNLYITKTIKHNIKSLFKITLNCFYLLYIFIKIRPNIVVGFGGITTVLPSIIAKTLDIPVIIHEQNSCMGKANRFIMRHISSECLLSFPATHNIIKHKKHSYVGFPLNDKAATITNHSRPKHSLSLLIIGGSQGARIFDEKIPNILKDFLRNNHIDYKLKIYQQVQKQNINIVSDIYAKLGIDCELKPFFHNIEEYFNKSDLLIARAGASTIFEILSFKIPALLIPMKNSSDNHQYLNAKEFNKIQPSIEFIEEDNISKLYDFFNKIFNNSMIIKKAYDELLMHKNNNSTATINKIITEVLNKNAK